VFQKGTSLFRTNSWVGEDAGVKELVLETITFAFHILVVENNINYLGIF